MVTFGSFHTNLWNGKNFNKSVTSVGTLQTGMFSINSKEFNRNNCMQIKLKQKAMSSTAWYERCMSTRESSTRSKWGHNILLDPMDFGHSSRFFVYLRTSWSVVCKHVLVMNIVEILFSWCSKTSINYGLNYSQHISRPPWSCWQP